jgi:hypothetical protein
MIDTKALAGHIIANENTLVSEVVKKLGTPMALEEDILMLLCLLTKTSKKAPGINSLTDDTRSYL